MRRQTAVSILMVLVALTASSAMAQLSGAIYTSMSSQVDGAWPPIGVSCETVNSNVTYPGKESVYLNGGPRNQSSSGISPDGSYYVQVTDPSGSQVLGTSGYDRPVQVVNGRFAACYQLWDIVKSGASGYTAKGYDDTPNNGGEYKVWISSQSDFKNSTTKTDNFKVAIERACTPPPPVTLTVSNCSDDNINCSNGSLQSLTGGRTYFTGDEIEFDLAVGGTSANVSYAIISLEQTLVNLFPSNPFGALCFLEEAYSLNSTHNGIDILPSGGLTSAGPVVVVATGSGFVGAGGTLKVTYVAPGPGHYFINATATATSSCGSSFETASCWPDAIDPNLSISASCPTSQTPFVGDQLSVPVTLVSNAPLTSVSFTANGGSPIAVSLSFNSTTGMYEGSSSVTLTAINGPLALNLSASGSYDPAGAGAPYQVNAQNSTTSACITGRLPVLTVSSSCPTTAPYAGQTLNVNVTLTSDAPLTEYSSLSVGLTGATCGPVTISGGVGSATCSVSDVNGGPYSFTLSGSGVFRGYDITAGVGSSSSPCPVRWPTVKATKYYDTDMDGTWDKPGECPVTPWTFSFTSGSTAVSLATGIATEIQLKVGASFTVCEAASSSWIATAGLCRSGVLTGSDEVEIGNVRLGAGGGLTLGFWSNKNGQALIESDDLAMLVGLNLKGATGSDYDPPSKTNFRSWLLNGTATNMSYMLSVQLSAMSLNVLNGNVSGASLIYAPGTTSANSLGFASVAAVMAEANAELGLHSIVMSDSPYRSYQEALKNALDRANNNLNFLQTAPTCGGDGSGSSLL